MLINSNSKLCNYNTSAEIQIIWCPWGEQVGIYFMFHSTEEMLFFQPWKQQNSPGWLLYPPPFVLLFSLLSRKTGPELTAGIQSA
jgi:hypothetical protein